MENSNKKPTIGDDLRPVEYEDINRANQLLYATALLSLLVFSLVKFSGCSGSMKNGEKNEKT